MSPCPCSTPTLFFLLIINVIHTFEAFGQIHVLTEGGPGQATNVLVYSHLLRRFCGHTATWHCLGPGLSTGVDGHHHYRSSNSSGWREGCTINECNAIQTYTRRRLRYRRIGHADFPDQHWPLHRLANRHRLPHQLQAATTKSSPIRLGFCPRTWTLRNYRSGLDHQFPLPASCSTASSRPGSSRIGQVLFCILAAFAFANPRFSGAQRPLLCDPRQSNDPL